MAANPDEMVSEASQEALKDLAADGANRITLLPVLGRLGGQRALEVTTDENLRARIERQVNMQ